MSLRPGAHPGAGPVSGFRSLASFGLPLSAVAVILGVDALMDMARTSVNLLGRLPTDMGHRTYIEADRGARRIRAQVLRARGLGNGDHPGVAQRPRDRHLRERLAAATRDGPLPAGKLAPFLADVQAAYERATAIAAARPPR